MKVAQIWYVGLDGASRPCNNKFYSKVGTALALARKYTAKPSPYTYFVKVFELNFVEDLE